MKQKFQCEVCKNYHDTPEAANQCEKEHLLPVEVLAAQYDAGSQGPNYVQVRFDNKRGSCYAATYKFVCWRDPDEKIPRSYQERVDDLVSSQLRKENAILQLRLAGKECQIRHLSNQIKQQADELAVLKKSMKPPVRSKTVNEADFEAFEKALVKALSRYSDSNIDIVFDDESGEFGIIYHSDCDSFRLYGAKLKSKRGDNFTKTWLVELADEYHVGWNF